MSSIWIVSSFIFHETRKTSRKRYSQVFSQLMNPTGARSPGSVVYRGVSGWTSCKVMAFRTVHGSSTRKHATHASPAAHKLLKDKGVSIMECDKDAFRKRVAVQTENFVKQRPEAKPVVDMIRSTHA